MNISNYAFNKITYQSLDMDKKIAVRTITFAPPLLKTISQEQSVSFKPQTQKCLAKQVCKTQKFTQIMQSHQLPINFFHSPGQYNRMLIKVKSPNTTDRPVGMVRSLEILNAELFEKQKQKRVQRINKYQEQMKHNKKNIIYENRKDQCVCCCCQNYCIECTTVCQNDGSERKKFQSFAQNKNSLLIDIEAIKNRQYTKKNLDHTAPKAVSYNPTKCNSKSGNIGKLINQSINKALEIQREKQIIRINQLQRKSYVQKYNQQVRTMNRKTLSKQHKERPQTSPPTKNEIRDAYWTSIKNMIAYELKKSRSKEKQPIQIYEECHQRKRKLTAMEIQQMRIKNGKKAIQQQKKKKEKMERHCQKRAKKLLALAAQQTQILKKCQSSKFKPTKQMIQVAFSHPS